MRKFICAIILLQGATGFAQTKRVVEDEQTWFGYFVQTRCKDNWGFSTDVHLRLKTNFIHELAQAVIRVGVNYYLTNDVKISAGYAYVNHFLAQNNTGLTQAEHRPWQQVQLHTKWPRFWFVQGFRSEQRYRRKLRNDTELAPGYNFNIRTRFNLLAQLALSKKPFSARSISAVISNEIFINWGKQIVYNSFDQNRAFAGVAIHINNRDNLQIGYMNVWQQLSAGNKYRSLHTARFFFFHNLDIRKQNGDASH